jgi:hypothetical protein
MQLYSSEGKDIVGFWWLLGGGGGGGCLPKLSSHFLLLLFLTVNSLYEGCCRQI